MLYGEGHEGRVTEQLQGTSYAVYRLRAPKPSRSGIEALSDIGTSTLPDEVRETLEVARDLVAYLQKSPAMKEFFKEAPK